MNALATAARRFLATEVDKEGKAARRVRKDFSEKMKNGPGFADFVGGMKEPLTTSEVMAKAGMKVKTRLPS
ncbi:hypothetical protein EC988_007476, partial [Linderina pennispora]